MTARAFLPLLALLTASVAVAQTKDGTLRIGDKAPPMKVAKWVKGAPTTTFKPGQVYVVEFWATWCGPCLTSIPHLTELQKKYGSQVKFNGIAVWQREAKDKYVGTVSAFVKSMGTKMDYAVAADTEPSNGAMANGWMTAAGQNGIPTAFVVGKDGSIAWIGHPVDIEMTKTLDAVLSGKFDAAGARASALKKAQAEAAMQAAFTKVIAAFKRNDDAAAEATMKDLVAKYPETASMVLSIRFNRHLEKGREKEAHETLRSEWATADLNASDLNSFAWDLVTSEKIKSRDYALAIAMATRGVEITEEKEPNIIDTLAYALFHSGKVTEAITWQQKAVDLTHGENAEMVAALTKYKKAKGQ